MATHGKAREATITALESRKPFKRSGYSMSAIAGAADSTGRMEDADALEYSGDRLQNKITYTVLSYSTPIAWVLTDGTVKVPDTYFSQTTTHQQGMCRRHL